MPVLLQMRQTAALNQLCLFPRNEGSGGKATKNHASPRVEPKLVHCIKQNSPDDPIQLAFSITDEQGIEEIITGEIRYGIDLLSDF
jgi:L-lysine 2,3-aminomutase